MMFTQMFTQRSLRGLSALGAPCALRSSFEGIAVLLIQGLVASAAKKVARQKEAPLQLLSALLNSSPQLSSPQLNSLPFFLPFCISRHSLFLLTPASSPPPPPPSLGVLSLKLRGALGGAEAGARAPRLAAGARRRKSKQQLITESKGGIERKSKQRS